MKNAYRDSYYMYLSARLSACDNRLTDEGFLRRIADAPTVSEAERMIREAFGEGAETPIEDVLTAALMKAYDFASELIGGTPALFEKPYEVLSPFRYAYDAQNLKAAIKCDSLGKIGAADSMYIDCGTVPAGKTAGYVTARDFGVYSRNIREAASAASEELAASHDPQCVDRALDKAAFADMADAAKSIGIPFLSALVAARADSVNIKIALRCMKRGIGKASLSALLVEGGTLDTLFFTDNYGETPDKLLSALTHTAYASIVTAENASDIERLAEDVYVEKAKSADRIAFGIERVIGYIAEAENGVKLLRVAFAYKKAGKAPEEIRKACRIAG